jgi:Ca2+/H+ antiporter, TMEM165/GDT1 family
MGIFSVAGMTARRYRTAPAVSNPSKGRHSCKLVDVTHTMPILFTSFMAALVECVEALTVVLAVGALRGWRSALGGTAAALVTLLAVVLLLGRSLASFPISALRIGIGLLLLLFGLRWLRKAILRASRVIPLHNEQQSFVKQSASLRLSLPSGGRFLDQIAFATAYKIVMVEGIEVIFIVIALGSDAGLLVPAALGAVAALVCVALLGLAMHRPLSRVPENILKFAVGVLISAFGTFWVGEGIGIAWRGEDLSLLALVVAYLGVACAMVIAFRGRAAAPTAISRTVSTNPTRGLLARVLTAIVSMFIDDGLLALATGIWVALCAVAVHVRLLTPVWEALGLAFGLVAILAFGGVRGAHLSLRSGRKRQMVDNY